MATAADEKYSKPQATSVRARLSIVSSLVSSMALIPEPLEEDEEKAWTELDAITPSLEEFKEFAAQLRAAGLARGDSE